MFQLELFYVKTKHCFYYPNISGQLLMTAFARLKSSPNFVDFSMPPTSDLLSILMIII